jgi:Flp pilus assembly protein TadG
VSVPVRRDERGTALIELMWLAVLLLVPMVWIVLSVFQVQRGAFAVTAAARAAGRAFALAPDDETGRRRAQAVAAVALADQGVTAPWDLTFACSPHDACHVAGAVVTVTVDSSVSLPFIPQVLGGAARFALHAEQRVPIGQFQESRG